MTINIGKNLFLITWTAATSLLGYSIYQDSKLQVIPLEEIGAIELIGGMVQVKPDAKIIWRDAYPGQTIGFNDSISTGPNGQATLSIRNSKPLKLGPNSVITLRSSRGSSKEIMIDLSRGILQTQNSDDGQNNQLASPNAPTIKIRTGKQTFALDGRNSEITIVKSDQNQKAEILKAMGNVKIQELNGNESNVERTNQINKIEQIDLSLRNRTDKAFELDISPKNGFNTSASLLSASSARTGTIELQPLKLYSPNSIEEKQPEVDKSQSEALALQSSFLMQSKSIGYKAYVPTISGIGNQAIGWIARSPTDLGHLTIPFVIAPPPSPIDTNLIWQPFIGGLNTGILAKLSGEQIKWPGTSKYAPQTIQVDLNRAQDLIEVLPGTTPIPGITFVIAPGATVQNSGTTANSKSSLGASSTIYLKSLLSIPDQPVRISFDTWDFSAPDRLVRWAKNSSSPTSIILKSAKDLPRLKGLMHDRAFSLELSSFPSNSGVFIVRGSQVIARVEGKLGTLANLSSLRDQLSANFMYRGQEADYIGNTMSYEKISQYLKTDKIYIMNGDRFIGINNEFLNRNSAVKDFLNSGNVTFFRAPIQRLGQYIPKP